MRRLLLALVATFFVMAPARANPAPLEGDWILVVLSDYEGGVFDLHLVRPDGSGLVNLTMGAAQDLTGEVSPDGTAIAFESIGESGLSQVWTMRVDGSDRQQLSPGFGTSPTWTPDGAAVVYGGLNELRIVNRDGSDDRLVAALPEGALAHVEPDVSPDGSTVVLDIQIETDRQIYSVPLAGGELTALTEEGGFEPEWSPDGSAILFTTFRDEFGDNAWVMNRDGSDEHNLFPSEFNDFQHSWSPEALLVVFESVRNEDIAIVIHDLATGEVADVLATSGAAAFRNPSWVKVTVVAPPEASPTTTLATTTTLESATTTSVVATTLAPVAADPGATDQGVNGALVGLLAALVASGAIGAFLVVASRRPGPPPPPPA